MRSEGFVFEIDESYFENRPENQSYFSNIPDEKLEEFVKQMYPEKDSDDDDNDDFQKKRRR
jgi:hypothetical protein